MGHRRGFDLLVMTAALVWPALARAQARCVESGVPAATTAWQGPLERRITLRADHISLREALDRIALATNLRFSYSADAIPLQRSVCFAYRELPVGDALAHLLRGTRLEPRAVGAEHIVLTPTRAPALPEPSDTAANVVTLEQLLVHSSAATTPSNGSPGGTLVIDGRALAQHPSLTLAAALNGIVPGLWLWQDATSGVATSQGGVRGAHSFRASAPTVYIDGIEVANSQLLTRIAPATVERVEIIRGPQGAALYGANALSGVINIITRRDHVDGGSPIRHLHTGFGAAASDFAAGTTFSQEHALGLALGSSGRSAGINVAVGTMGEFAPDAGAQHVVADAFGRVLRSRSMVTATLRFFGERAGVARSPLVADAEPVGPRDPAGLPATRQYTAGLSARFQPGAHWTHSLLLGVDGFNIDRPVSALALTGTAGDAVSDATRATARFSSVRAFGGQGTSGTLTLAAEHALLRQRGTTTAEAAAYVHAAQGPGPSAWDGAGTRLDPATPLGAPSGNPALPFDQLASNTGISAQSTLVWNERLHFTAGVRLEQNGSPFDFGPWAVLPMTGSALTVMSGDIGLKVHAAWGKTIRWPAQPTWATSWQQQQYFRLTQPAEEQSGVEAGVDLRWGRQANLQLIHFRQTATGLTRNAATQLNGSHHQPLPGIGTIGNSGWEVVSSWKRGPLSLNGSVTLVDSRVTDLADDYRGELRPGDRMLLVPAQTASITAGWTRQNWSASLTAARARDWINYDRVALLNDRAASNEVIDGDRLRRYWRAYQGHTHLSVAASRQLTDRFLLLLGATNLLDAQLGEPDNVTVVPGRTLSLGVRARF